MASIRARAPVVLGGRGAGVGLSVTSMCLASGPKEEGAPFSTAPWAPLMPARAGSKAAVRGAGCPLDAVRARGTGLRESQGGGAKSQRLSGCRCCCNNSGRFRSSAAGFSDTALVRCSDLTENSDVCGAIGPGAVGVVGVWSTIVLVSRGCSGNMIHCVRSVPVTNSPSRGSTEGYREKG